MEAIEISFWYWWVAAMAFVVLEILAPGIAFLWLGVGAAAVGFLLLVVPALSLSLQILVFAVLSVAGAILGRRWFRPKPSDSDEPALNRRGASYVGRVFVLSTAIENGYGRAKIGDGVWTVRGDDMPKGARIRVIGADGATLLVERHVDTGASAEPA